MKIFSVNSKTLCIVNKYRIITRNITDYTCVVNADNNIQLRCRDVDVETFRKLLNTTILLTLDGLIGNLWDPFGYWSSCSKKTWFYNEFCLIKSTRIFYFRFYYFFIWSILLDIYFIIFDRYIDFILRNRLHETSLSNKLRNQNRIYNIDSN